MENKINFNNNSKLADVLRDKSEMYISMIKDGDTPEDIAVKLYMKNMRISEHDAQNAIKVINGYINDYHTDMEKFTEDKDAWVRTMLKERTELFASAKERCEFYHRTELALEVYKILHSGEENAQEKAEAFINENLHYEYSEDEAAEMENELFETVAEKISQTDFLSVEMQEILEQVKSANLEDVPAVAVKYGRESEGIKLILAAQACADAKNKQYNDIGALTDQKDITYAVCAAVDLNAVAIGVDRGQVKLCVFQSILRTVGVFLGGAAIVSMASVLSVALTSAIIPILSFAPWLAVIIGCLVNLYILHECFLDFASDLGDIFEHIGKPLDWGLSKLVDIIRNNIADKKMTEDNNSEADSEDRRVYLSKKTQKIKNLTEDQKPRECDVVFTPYYQHNTNTAKA